MNAAWVLLLWQCIVSIVLTQTHASRWIPRDTDDLIAASVSSFHHRRVQSPLNTTPTAAPTVGFEGLTSPHHAGYINVDYANDGDIFYWHFDANPADSSESAATLPLVIWLQGGPGCSSLIGLFLECGPFRMNEEGSVETNPHGWHKAANVLFVDQPVGTGMSRVKHDAYPSSGEQVAAQFYRFLVGFLEQHPQYVSGASTRPIYLFGESHAGRWIPQFHTYIAAQNAKHEQSPTPSSIHIRIDGVGIGNGWIHPRIQYDYSAFAHGLGLISHAQRRALELQFTECETAIDSGNLNAPVCFHNLDSILASVKGSAVGGGLNVFDVRVRGSAAQYPPQKPLLASFLNRADVRQAIAWTARDKQATHPFEECSARVNRNLAGEDAVSTAGDVQAMLATGVRVLLYNGQWDMMCNALNTEKLVEQLDWPGRGLYQTARRFTWHSNAAAAAGFVQTGGNLTTIVVQDAGHLVPFNAPAAALDMVRRFIYGRSFQDVVQEVKPEGGGGAARCAGQPATTASTGHVAVVAVTSAVLAALLTFFVMRPRAVAAKHRDERGDQGGDDSGDDDESSDDGDHDALIHADGAGRRDAAALTGRAIKPRSDPSRAVDGEV